MTSSRTDSEEAPLAQLPRMLRSAWEQHRQKVRRTVIRVASFNLLVVSSGETDPHLAEIVEGLQASHPCRLIWTKLKPEKEWDESTAALSLVTRCEGRQVCSEQIVLRCGNDRARIPSVVLPLIEAGLPTHMIWWKAGPLDGPLFRRLHDRAKLTLWQPEAPPSNWALEYLDRTWSDPYQFEHATYPLDWFRILGRRKAVARAYDHGPVKLRAFDPGAEMSLKHKLLRGWLVSRLGNASEVDFQWTSGRSGCQIGNEEPQDLPLLEDLQAVRVALDQAERDPVFAHSLKALLAPAAR